MSYTIVSDNMEAVRFPTSVKRLLATRSIEGMPEISVWTTDTWELSTMDETSIRFAGNNLACIEAKVLWNSFLLALGVNTKLPQSVRNMKGFSGRKYRYLINNLVAAIGDARYLEVGSWLGSTACAAMYGNKLDILCIDDWSQSWPQFSGQVAPREQFFSNTKACMNDAIRFSALESDFRKVDFGQIGKFNIYLFDGPHEEIDQYDGVRVAQRALDDTHFLIVDDWNLPEVRKGTNDAILKEGIEVPFQIVIRTAINGDAEWHNGYLIAVCHKST